ncbi:hypothetical protein [Polyangium sp. 15x6]|uniref:hypothetical protein n=1 Tax=Polyangium sp. 15x6 TaxID=3042687 RepID=UPI00249C833E|nr:hypothetical protein [Polyangium sp. 15x6]MDI3286733.1 hypothetical protein [Polyangium sp. 15x6]
MRGAILGVLGILLVGCGGSPLPGGSDDACPTDELGEAGARVFVLQPRVDPAHFESYDSYRAHLVGLVQAHVSPCLAMDRPNVVVFPENTGLSAGFVGSRGETARVSSGALPAFLTLGGQYKKPIDFYKSKWPEVPLPTQILLGLTDTAWRAFHETNQAIVEETGAWLVSSTNVSGLVERSADPAEIEALADPDLQDVSYVYVARDPAVYNAAFVYGPDGEIVASRKKPYPILMEEVDLALTPGPLREVMPMDIGPLGVGIVTSKDAWMPDMVDRLSALGADVFFQPEAFSGWTIPESPDEPNAWAPDILGQSTMAAVQKHGAVRYGVVPHLTGNLFDLPFDGQSIIVGDMVPGEARRAYVGQNEMGGVIEVAPWVVPDPVENDSAATLESRRTSLRVVGEELLPAGVRKNQYVETVIAADLDPALPFPLASAGPPGALGPSQALQGMGDAEQSHPALAWSGGGPLVLAFQEGSRGATRVLVATSEDEGKTFGVPHAAASGGEAQITPAVLATGDHVYVAYQERSAGGARVACVLSTDRGKTFGAPVFLPSEGTTPDAWLPALASAKGRVFLAYVDGSSGNERVMLARAPEGTVDFEVQPIEGTKKHPGSDIRNNQWAPAVAALGDEVAVSWVDFRGYNWDVFLARSVDGGMSFGAPVRVDDGMDAPERLHDDPSLLFVPGGGAVTVALGWSDMRKREPNATARVSLVSGNVIGQGRKLGEGPAEGSAFRPRLVALGAGSVAAVWQDDRTGGKDVYLATSTDGGASFGAEKRIDDGGDGPSYQTGPAAAANGIGGMVAAWEDTRSGRRRIRWVAGKP